MHEYNLLIFHVFRFVSPDSVLVPLFTNNTRGVQGLTFRNKALILALGYMRVTSHPWQGQTEHIALNAIKMAGVPANSFSLITYLFVHLSVNSIVDTTNSMNLAVVKCLLIVYKGVFLMTTAECLFCLIWLAF